MTREVQNYLERARQKGTLSMAGFAMSPAHSPLLFPSLGLAATPEPPPTSMDMRPRVTSGANYP